MSWPNASPSPVWARMIRSVVARGSEPREDLPQLVEVGPPGLHGRRVGGVEAPVDQADERLGRQRELGQAIAVLRGHERDLLAGLQGEVPDGAARGHVQSPLDPAGLACPGDDLAERVDEQAN